MSADETGLTVWEGADADEILAQMERSAFAPHRFDVPIGTGDMYAVRLGRCGRCGAVATRSELDLVSQVRTFFCEACR